MIFKNTGLTENSIIFDFDISNIKSYDNNSGFTITSTTFWNNYKLSDLTLTGYGQTMFDYGLSTSYTEEKTYKLRDRNLIFKPIGYNDPSGNTTQLGLIQLNSGNTEGNYFILSGGYLSTFFKIPERNFELSKYRFEDGFTIDTWLYIDNNTFDKITSYTEGNFLYLGTKSENKFNIYYSAITDITSVTYDTNNYLDDIEFNSVSFKFNDDKTISLRYIGVSGLTTELKTQKPILNTGWTNFVFTFQACEKIRPSYDSPNDMNGDLDVYLDCKPFRNGNFSIYINGKEYFNQKEMEEFIWLKKLQTEVDRQIGVPFTINWGGGSFGLKNSYFQSTTSYTATSAVTTGITYISGTNLIVAGDNGTFDNNIDDMYFDLLSITTTTSNAQFISGNSLLLTSDAITSLTNDTTVYFDLGININPDKKYIYKGYIYDDSNYIDETLKNINLSIYQGFDPEITIITSTTYTINDSLQSWVELSIEFDTPSIITGSTEIYPTIVINNIDNINGLSLYLDEYTLIEYTGTPSTGLTSYTVTEEILLNKNLKSLIQDNFDGSFYGGIQKLRLYDKSLNFNEVRNNYNYFSNKYSFTKIK